MKVRGKFAAWGLAESYLFPSHRQSKTGVFLQAAVWHVTALCSRNRCACKGGLATLIVLICCSVFSVGCKDHAYIVDYEPGPIQVIGFDREVWLFVEVDRMVERPYGACDAPSRIPVGHWQEVIAIKETGEVTRTKVRRHDNSDGVTFNKNISSILRLGDRIMLYKSESAQRAPTVYEWTGQEFLRLSREANARFLIENGLEGYKSAMTQLDNWSQSGGWRVIHSELSVRDDSYSWGKLTINQHVRFDQGDYRIEIVATNVAMDPIVIEVSGKPEKISASQYKELSREDYGYLKGK
ncbi:MAG TPA: hypothetical protein VN673_11245 [Clostridia bacterium]|nr:hypothetical protein [Clostridia bacterium]